MSVDGCLRDDGTAVVSTGDHLGLAGSEMMLERDEFTSVQTLAEVVAVMQKRPWVGREPLRG